MPGVQSVERAIALLSQIAQEPAGLVELAEAVKLPTSTAARMLSTLEGLEAVTRDDAGEYSIGRTIISMATAADYEPTLRGTAYPHMLDLVGTLDEAIGLSVPAGDDLVTVEKADVPRAVQAEDWTGTRWPFHVGSSGLVLMATWPSERVDSYLADLPDGDRVRHRLGLARKTGVAWSHGDYVEDLSSVAAAITDAAGLGVASLYAYGPSYRFPVPGSATRIEAELLTKAETISRIWSGQSGTGTTS